jgi:catechol 2,3-dioxygenase-like lactoylglutathione lyase family enzyme
MEVRGLHWAGVRTANFPAAVRFFRDMLGLSLEDHNEAATVAGFRLPSGQLFEVFGPASRYYPLHERPVFGFDVDDVVAARAEMEAAGVEFVTDVASSHTGEAWTYFRGPERVLYELTQHARE